MLSANVTNELTRLLPAGFRGKTDGWAADELGHDSPIQCVSIHQAAGLSRAYQGSGWCDLTVTVIERSHILSLGAGVLGCLGPCGGWGLAAAKEEQQ